MTPEQADAFMDDLQGIMEKHKMAAIIYTLADVRDNNVMFVEPCALCMANDGLEAGCKFAAKRIGEFMHTIGEEVVGAAQAAERVN